MDAMHFDLVHEVGNRARWKTANVMTRASAAFMADEISAIGGVLGVQVNARTGSVTATFESAAAKQAVARYLVSLETNPVILRRPKSDPLVEISRADMPQAARRAAGLFDKAGRIWTRAVCTMPVVQAAREPKSFQSRDSEDQDAALDFTPLVRWVTVRPLMPLIVNGINAILGAIPYVIDGIKALFKGKLTVEVLDAAAITVSLLRRDFRTAGIVILLLGIGDMLERYTRKKSLRSLADQLSVHIDKVWVRRGEAAVEIPFAELGEQDVVVVRTGNTIPVDGTVVAGDAAVNQATMTGEPLPVHRTAGGSVFAGTVVEDGEIDIAPTQTGQGTRLNQIIQFIENSEQTKASIQGRAERLADAIVPFNFLLFFLVLATTRNFARASAVLMVDYSCALRLATPLAILSAMKEGVSRGVLVKGGRFLEALSEVDTVVFDKTGTLTQASPKLTDVVPVDGRISQKEMLTLAACLEEHFPHPVSRAVVAAAREQGLEHAVEAHDANVEYVVAHGICSSVDGEKIIIGSRHFVEEDEGVDVSGGLAEVDRLASQGKTVLYMAHGGRLMGLIGIADPLRPESCEVIAKLRASGIKRVVMLTGDEEKTARNVARILGVDDYRSQVLPTDEACYSDQRKKQGAKVLMVGDGINDSPALSAAYVGATLREGSAIAQEVADVVFANNTLSDIPYAIELGRAAMRKINQNFRVSVGLNTCFLGGGLLGILPPATGAVLHNATTIGVCANALRSPTGRSPEKINWFSRTLEVLSAPESVN